MQLNNNRNPRIALLVVALSMIGGTGCVHYLLPHTTPKETQQQEDERKMRDKQWRERAVLQRKYFLDSLIPRAANNELLAKRLLGLQYLQSNGHFPKDVDKGLALLRSAIDEKDVVAEYVYGWLLVQGGPKNNDYDIKLNSNEFSTAPEIGIKLIEKVATRICHVSSYDIERADSPALDVSFLYAEGKYIERNERKSELWLARHLLHCGDGLSLTYNPVGISGYKYFSKPKILAFLSLQAGLHNQMPRAYFVGIATKYAADLKPEEVAESKIIVENLLQAVRLSEKEFPDPTTYKGKK